MKTLFSWPNSIFLFFFSLLTFAVFFNLNSPLQGLHSIRQADTTFAGWSYCFENAELLKPRIAHRGNGQGIVIGEFPAFSTMISLPCKMGLPWFEWWPRLLSFFFFVSSAVLWGLWLKRQNNGQIQWPVWLLLYFACTNYLNHYTIPIPDGMAISCIAMAGLFWQSSKKANHVLAQILFVLAFAMRPYLIPLLFLVAPLRQSVISFVLCGLVYLGWYKWWILQSEWAYYYTQLLTPRELLSQLPKAGLGLIEYLFRDVLHFVAVIPLALYWRKFGMTRWAWLWLFAVVLVILLRGSHIVHHSYYLVAATLILLLMLYQGLQLLKPKHQTILLVLYMLVSIANVQHLWRRQAYDKWQGVLEAKKEHPISFEDRVVTYVGDDEHASTYLYWGKMIGWSQMETQFQGAENCPEGAKYFLRYEGDKPKIHACVRTP